jgi:voltage-dependent calcium channel L type alpha-1F
LVGFSLPLQLIPLLGNYILLNVFLAIAVDSLAGGSTEEVVKEGDGEEMMPPEEGEGEGKEEEGSRCGEEEDSVKISMDGGEEEEEASSRGRGGEEAAKFLEGKEEEGEAPAEVDMDEDGDEDNDKQPIPEGKVCFFMGPKHPFRLLCYNFINHPVGFCASAAVTWSLTAPNAALHSGVQPQSNALGHGKNIY